MKAKAALHGLCRVKCKRLRAVIGLTYGKEGRDYLVLTVNSVLSFVLARVAPRPTYQLHNSNSDPLL